MRMLNAATFTLAVLLITGTLLAQNDGPGGPPGERGGPPGGGRPGFGRGMGGDRNSYLGLIRIDKVREELKITDEQHEKIRSAVEEIRSGLPAPDVDFGSLRDAPPEERQAAWAKMQEFGAKFEKEVRTRLAGVLDETQMKRLRGLWVQRAGAVVALNDADIAAELKLDDDQKAQLKAQADEQRGQMRGGFGFGGRPRGEGNPPADGNPPPRGEGGGNFLERFREARKAADDKALAVLSDEQKAAFAAIQGEAFEFPPPQFGGPGGFGGGRGRGGDGEGGPRRRGGPGRDAE